MTRSLLRCILLGLLFLVAGECWADWPLFHGDLARTGYSPEVTTAGLVELWQIDLGSPIYGSPVIAEGKIYVSVADAHLYAFDAASGNPVWQIEPGSWLESTPTIDQNRLYFGCVDHAVYCVDALSGSAFWQYETESWVESSPLVFDGKVFIGGMDHHLYVFDAIDGTLQYMIQTTGDVLTVPATDGSSVFFSGDDEKIHAITASGTSLWTVDAPGPVYGAPVSAEGKVLYGTIANGQGLSYNRLVALDAGTGGQIWQHEFVEYDFLYGTPTVGYGNVYIGGFQGAVYAFDLDDGSPVWTRSLGDWSLLSSPALSEGVLYVGSNDGNIYALDAFTGVVLDQAETGGFVQSSPAVSDGILAVGSAGGILYTFSLNSAVEVTATPISTVVPPGGILEFDVELGERTGQAQSFLGWMGLTQPNGVQRNVGSPVALTLDPYEQRLLSGRLNVPISAPAAAYYLAVNVGPSQSEIWDASSFGFSVTSAEDQIENGGDWSFSLGGQKGATAAADPQQPEEYALQSPYPNPFNPATTLTFSLPEKGPVSLKVYDASGRRAATLIDGERDAGIHQVRWDAQGFSSGVYFVLLKAGGKVLAQRAVLSK